MRVGLLLAAILLSSCTGNAPQWCQDFCAAGGSRIRNFIDSDYDQLVNCADGGYGRGKSICEHHGGDVGGSGTESPKICVCWDDVQTHRF